MKKLPLLVLSAVAVACSSASPNGPHAASTTASIVGGTADTGDPAVGYVSAWDGDTGWACTGTLIAPNIVATAAHCVVDATATTKFQVAFVSDEGAAQTSDWHDASSVDHDPDYLKTGFINDGHDCAVVVLTTPITDVKPIALNQEPVDDTWNGLPLRLIGYGDTDGSTGSGSGTKRQVTVPIQDHRDGVIEINTPGHTTCQGDSGGPGLVTRNGVEVLTTITSYGDFGCPGDAGLSRADLCGAFFAKYVSPPAQ